MLNHMKPGETIAKALRRLGGNKGKQMTSSQRWKAKKQKTEDTVEDKQGAKDKENFLALTGLADRVLQGGDMEVYEMTHEKLTYELKKFEKGDERVKIPEGTDDDDDALDMFADDIDHKEAEKIEKDMDIAEKTNDDADTKTDEKLEERKGNNKINNLNHVISHICIHVFGLAIFVYLHSIKTWHK